MGFEPTHLVLLSVPKSQLLTNHNTTEPKKEVLKVHRVVWETTDKEVAAKMLEKIFFFNARSYQIRLLSFHSPLNVLFWVGLQRDYTYAILPCDVEISNIWGASSCTVGDISPITALRWYGKEELFAYLHTWPIGEGISRCKGPIVPPLKATMPVKNKNL